MHQITGEIGGEGREQGVLFPRLSERGMVKNFVNSYAQNH